MIVVPHADTKSNGRYFQGMAQSAIDKSHQVQSWTR
jgi:hypothetical protein